VPRRCSQRGDEFAKLIEVSRHGFVRPLLTKGSELSFRIGNPYERLWWVLGRLMSCVWLHDPTIPAPARYRRSCRYDAFIPINISETSLEFSGDVAGSVSEAENAIRLFNASAGPSLDPLARLLLRTESIASSKVEGMQVDARRLARAESKADSGRTVSATEIGVLANIDAMQLAIEEATSVESLDID
jgi:hypothetical protein